MAYDKIVNDRKIRDTFRIKKKQNEIEKRDVLKYNKALF